MVDILQLLKGSDRPAEDQLKFIKAQILFWLIGATDGHAKNFCIFLWPGGRYSLTPLYDVLTAQPSLDTRQIERKQMKLAMSAGANRHYRIDDIFARHFVQTCEKSGIPAALAKQACEDIAERATSVAFKLEATLPADFPESIHDSVMTALQARVRRLKIG